MGVTRASGHRSAVGLVLAGQCANQIGAAAAVTLLPAVGIGAVVALRLTLAAALLLAFCRPRIRGRARADWLCVWVFGGVLASMNVLFYGAVERIPLGAAVTVEVLGPLALSVRTGRRLASWCWAGLALAGIALLGRAGMPGLTGAGVACAGGAAVMWGCYIPLSARVGRVFAGLDGLALAMAFGATLVAPWALTEAGPRLWHPAALTLGAAVAVLSTLAPFCCELVALRRLSATTCGVLMSLAPAGASVAGAVLLGQPMDLVSTGAVAAVVVAGVGAVQERRSGR
jgi:inner membrane transporter RhtA